MTQLDEWQTTPVVQAAREKLGTLPDNFRIYFAEWLGDMRTDACVMKLKGCEFRIAKSGPNKGKLLIKVPGTERDTYLSSSEVRAVVSIAAAAQMEL